MSYAGARDGRHYWLTPPDMMEELDSEFAFDFDPCPYPRPDDFDGLTAEWGNSNYVNPPFGGVTQNNGKVVGPTAWARKAIAEYRKGKRVVLVYPIDKWIHMLLTEGASVRNLGDVRWCSTEDGQPGVGTGRWVAAFILGPGAETENRRHPKGGDVMSIETRPALDGIAEEQRVLALAHWYLWRAMSERVPGIAWAHTGCTPEIVLRALECAMQPETLHRLAMARDRYWKESENR